MSAPFPFFSGKEKAKPRSRETRTAEKETLAKKRS
jgi:hypothetical protein